MFFKFIFLFSLFISIDSFADSCVCSQAPTVEEAYQNSNYVFTGRVESIRYVNPYDYIVKFKVINVWKGPKEKYHFIASTRFRSECGYDFATGHRYLVYSYLTPKSWSATNHCGRTDDFYNISSEEFAMLSSLKAAFLKKK